MEIRTKYIWLDKNFVINYYFAICLYSPFSCVYREKETPSSIPNLAVKLLFADDTALFKCGNVGRCKDWGKSFQIS